MGLHDENRRDAMRRAAKIKSYEFPDMHAAFDLLKEEYPEARCAQTLGRPWLIKVVTETHAAHVNTPCRVEITRMGWFTRFAIYGTGPRLDFLHVPDGFENWRQFLGARDLLMKEVGDK